MRHIVAVTQADDEHAHPSFHRGYRKQFSFEEDLVPTIVEPHHVAILVREVIAARSPFPFPENCIRHENPGRRCHRPRIVAVCGAHISSRKVGTTRKTGNGIGDRPWIWRICVPNAHPCSRPPPFSGSVPRARIKDRRERNCRREVVASAHSAIHCRRKRGSIVTADHPSSRVACEAWRPGIGRIGEHRQQRPVS